MNSIDPSLEETGDRSLILEGPVKLRPLGQEEPIERDVWLIMVPADHIKTMEVCYMKPGR